MISQIPQRHRLQILPDEMQRNIETLIELCNHQGIIDRYAIIAAETYARKMHFAGYDVERHDQEIAQMKKIYYAQERGRK